MAGWTCGDDGLADGEQGGGPAVEPPRRRGRTTGWQVPLAG